jgi:hypothetical protein
MKKLDGLIEKLNTDALAAVTITDNDTGETICKNKLSLSILAEFENTEAFFDSLLEKGHSNLTVEPRRKNGNAFKPSGEIFTISPEVAEPQNNMIAQPTTETFVKKKKKKKTNMFGLGAPEILQLNVKASQVDSLNLDKLELKSEVKRLTDKVEDLKDKIEELRTEALEKRFTKENNDSRNNLISTALGQAPTIAAALGITIPSAGLSAPAQNLSEVQGKLLEIIKMNDDNLNQIMINILTRIAAKTPEDTFETEFVDLLTRNNIN